MKNLRTTFRADGKQLTLAYSMADLAQMMSSHFSQEIGVFENHSVAGGMATNRWVIRKRLQILDATETPSTNRTLQHYFRDLRSFLASVSDEDVQIRHHYA